MAKGLKDLKLKMIVDTSQVDAALSEIDATLLADEYGSAGRRLTAVDGLIAETIAGDARLGAKAARADAAKSAAWEAVARDLARQVINAETEIAELDAVIEDREDAVSAPPADSEDVRKYWEARAEIGSLRISLRDEQQAHCDTYIEAVRLSTELAGWQDSDGAQYRKSTAAARLNSYQTST